MKEINIENIKELYHYKLDKENRNITFDKLEIKSYKVNEDEPQRYIDIITENDEKYNLDLILSERYDNEYVILWKEEKHFVNHPEEYFYTLEDAKKRAVDVLSYWNKKHNDEIKELQNNVNINDIIIEHIIMDTVNYNYLRYENTNYNDSGRIGES